MTEPIDPQNEIVSSDTADTKIQIENVPAENHDTENVAVEQDSEPEVNEQELRKDWAGVSVPAPENCEEVDEEGNKMYRDKDGYAFVWDDQKKAWFPKLDLDTFLQYQTNYYTETPETTALDQSNLTQNTNTIGQSHIAAPAQLNTVTTSGEGNVAETNQETTSKKRSAPSWFNLNPEQNTKVYVSNLPLDITLDEFAEIMGKCGMINRDPDNNKFKLKLYTEPNGQIKGDGICDYIKMESVTLALNILDGYVHRGQKLSVQRAEFKMRGDYDPTLKPKKRKKDKAKLKKMKEKLFDWRPERMRGERAKFERIVIIKNYFHPKVFEDAVELLLEYQNNLREECSKCGTVNKVVLYDRHEEGVAQVNMSSPEEADLVIQMMHNRLFGKRQLTAEHWDGKTKYKSFETETDEEKRLSTWQEFLESNDDNEQDIKQKEPIEPDNETVETTVT